MDDHMNAHIHPDGSIQYHDHKGGTVNKELEAKGYTEEDEKYLRAYSDGFIDALDQAELITLEERQASPLRDTAREASILALMKLADRAMARAVVLDPFEEDNPAEPDFDLGGEG